jgi:hypothetical protein
MKKLIFVLFCTLFYSFTHAYDATTTHKLITTNAISVFSSNYSTQIDNDDINKIIDGNWDEDNRAR